MQKKYGFSLAEALITLLVVSLIIVLSTPMITKKTKPNSDLRYWSSTQLYPNSIIPVSNKNIVVGSTGNAKNSIIVSGVLEFKNKKGETIGWIAEDGTSSGQSHAEAERKMAGGAGRPVRDGVQERNPGG